MTNKNSININILKSAQHQLTKNQVNKNVLSILKKLKEANFHAYIVGGGVRDLLLGHKPKDFDIATDATPDQVRTLFKNSRIIGRRFRLVHVYFDREIIEVATFRAPPSENLAKINTKGNKNNQDDYKHLANSAHLEIDGQIIRDNVYGSLDEDIWRRDFTINALYYDPYDDQYKSPEGIIVDYCNGFEDLKNHTIRVLGDPLVRYREDPVRMLRALRFAAKLNFTVEKQSLQPIHDYQYIDLLNNVPPARLFEEYNKLFLTGHCAKSFELLNKHKLLHKLFPMTANARVIQAFPQHIEFLQKVLTNTDNRIANDLPVNPAFLLAAFLWHPLQLEHKNLQPKNSVKNSREHIWRDATHKIIKEQVAHLAIPKRFTKVMDEIWLLQRLFSKSNKKSLERAALHPKFRAGFDFLMLRSEFEDISAKKLQWWQQYEKADYPKRIELLNNYNDK